MEISCDIAWFAERDIDIWLAEELRLNAHFARWFLDKLGKQTSISVPAYRTRPSVCDGRETDVEALFRMADGNTFAVLIEDKIKAEFQPGQMEDYQRRGERGVDEHQWAEFAVAVFAPAYRTPFTSLPEDAFTITFEEAAHTIKGNSIDHRTLYRALFLERAAQPKAIVAEGVDEFKIEWWRAVSQMVREKLGDFFLPQIPKKTNYVNPRTPDMPSYLRLDLKGNQGEVALAFKGFPEKLLRSLVSSLKPDGVEVFKGTWKDPVLRISNLPKFHTGDELAVVADRVHSAYGAAHKLVSVWRANRDLFDVAAAELPAKES
jgi:hypothetical protein